MPKISELNKEHLARKYLEDRQIPQEYLSDLYYCEKFKEWTNTQKHTFESLKNDEPRIIIPLVHENKIFGFQGRSLNKQSKIKYITIILDEEQPKIYGLDKVRKDATVYITEGPFDSTFIRNAVAMWKLTVMSVVGVLAILFTSMIMNPAIERSSIESVEQSIVETP